ncbi:predicted protein [Botrytis cinerea T4]|uniref:Uncharacterized protein n=1 Tax=Botryotinia fuckeliana (strain T4) TaxID=999810 RepID=G2XRN0_BOTF4|nr:predicted protein [Botrytis cinerea T4]
MFLPDISFKRDYIRTTRISLESLGDYSKDYLGIFKLGRETARENWPVNYPNTTLLLSQSLSLMAK